MAGHIPGGPEYPEAPLAQQHGLAGCRPWWGSQPHAQEAPFPDLRYASGRLPYLALFGLISYMPRDRRFIALNIATLAI
jgi:hypothetical protein